MFTNKKNGTNRILALALVLCMVIGMFTMAASAEDAAVFSATATEAVEVTGAGYYPVTVTLTNPTETDYEVTLDQVSGPALTYMGNEEENGTVAVPAYTEQVVSGYLTYVDGAAIEDVVVEVAADDVLAEVTIAVTGNIAEEPYVMRAMTWDFEDGMQGWSGSSDWNEAAGALNVWESGFARFNTPLKLKAGHLYKMVVTAKSGSDNGGIIISVNDFNAAAVPMATEKSLNELAVLSADYAEYEFRFVANNAGGAGYAYSTLGIDGALSDNVFDYRHGHVSVDKIVLVDCGKAEKVEVINGSFENFVLEGDGTYASFANWTSGMTAYQGSTHMDWYDYTPEAVEGNEMMAVTRDIYDFKYTQQLFDTSDEVTITYWARSNYGGQVAQNNVDLGIMEYDADGNQIGSTQVYSDFSRFDKWMSHEVTYTKPADVANFRFGMTFGVTCPKGNWFDHVTMYKTGAASAVTEEEIAAAEAIEIYNPDNEEIVLGEVKAATWYFDEGLEDWVNSVAYEDGTMIMTEAGGVYYRFGLELNPGHLYKLTAKIKSQGDGSGFFAYVNDYDADGNLLATPQSINELTIVTTEYTEYEWRFVANNTGDEAYAYSRLGFDSARSDNWTEFRHGATYFDEVVLVDCGPAVEIEVANGSFENFSGGGEAYVYATFDNWTSGMTAYQGSISPSWYNEIPTPIEGNETMAVSRDYYDYKYTQQMFETSAEVLITYWSQAKYGGQMAENWVEMGIMEYSGEEIANTVKVRETLCFDRWGSHGITYTKPANVEGFRFGMCFGVTCPKGNYFDHVTMYKSGAASAVTAQDIAGAAPISGFNGTVHVPGVEANPDAPGAGTGSIPTLSAPVGTELDRPIAPPVVETGTISHKGNTLSLDGIVFINQYTNIDGFGGQEYIEANGGLLIWKTPVTEETATFENAEDVVEGLTYDTKNAAYVQTTRGIASKMFADELYLRAYVKDAAGNYHYGPIKEYSVQAYCEGRLEKSTNAKMKAVASQMLHYGAAAQTYFKYNLSDLANANIAAKYPSDTWNADLLDAAVEPTSKPSYAIEAKNYGKTLSLDGTVLINYYYDVASGFNYKIAGGKLQIWDGVTALTEDNISYEVDLEYTLYGNNKTPLWTAACEGFIAKAYSKTIYARGALVDTEGNVHYSDIVAYSPEEYAKGRIDKSTDANMVELAKQLVMYGERARLYLG